MFALLKAALPNRAVHTRILRGPFRGARVLMNPRHSLRKILGLYEHELNGWLEAALPRVTRLIDVGAADGYFTFGCAAAFRRLGVRGDITGFEPHPPFAEVLRGSIAAQGTLDVNIEIVNLLVGRQVGAGMTTLDALPDSASRRNTLIKIDVEGAEIDVLMGARSWLEPSNLFLIEVHKPEYLAEITRLFASRGLKLRQVNQRPLPLLGAEVREANNWWLVTDLGER